MPVTKIERNKKEEKSESKSISNITKMHNMNPVQQVMDQIKSPNVDSKKNNVLPLETSAIDEGYSSDDESDDIDKEFKELENEVNAKDDSSKDNVYITRSEMERMLERNNDKLLAKMKSNNNLDYIIDLFYTTHSNSHLSDSIYTLKCSDNKIDVNKTINEIYGKKPIYLNFLMEDNDSLCIELKSLLSINEDIKMADVISKLKVGPELMINGDATIRDLCNYLNACINSKTSKPEPVYSDIRKYLIRVDKNSLVDSKTITDSYIVCSTH